MGLGRVPLRWGLGNGQGCPGSGGYINGVPGIFGGLKKAGEDAQGGLCSGVPVPTFEAMPVFWKFAITTLPYAPYPLITQNNIPIVSDEFNVTSGRYESKFAKINLPFYIK